MVFGPRVPGAIVREEILLPLGLNATMAAKALGVRRAALSDLPNEKAALSPEMALRIEKAFGVNREMLKRVQTAWGIATTR
jgi:antitoxin HigA-1